MRRYDVQSIIWGFAGFVLGAGGVVLIEFLLIAMLTRPGYYFAPRGLGWVGIPIAAGVAGAGIGARFRLKALDDILSSHKQIKVALVGILAWAIAYLGFVYLARPFGSYWGNDGWDGFWRWFLIPPVLVAAVGGLIFWMLRGPARNALPLEIPTVGTAEMSKADRIRATLEPLIATSKTLGASSPRMAFDITIGRSSTDEEWERHREPWELLWPHVKPL